MSLFAASLLAAALGAGQSLSDSMTLTEIEAAIAAHPPGPEHRAARQQIALSLDRHVRVHVRDGMTDEDRAALRPLRDLYRRRVDAGLDRLERTRVTEGVHVFKFYSSSFILKSAEGTVAVDFAQGPIADNTGEPEACDHRQTGFYWTSEQRDRLAKRVDVSLITHRHHDHSDYSLSKRLLARGGTVVVPAQFKGIWKDLADRLTVPDYGREQKLGPVTIVTMLGSQYGTNRADEKGVRWGHPSPDRDADSETILYLFRLGGLVFIQAGENHVPAQDWLNARAEAGFVPDVRMSLGQFQGARSAEAFLKTKPPCYVLPIHEYEMTHAGGGNRMGGRFGDAGRSMPLFWGEDFLLTRETVERSRKKTP